MTRSPRAAFKRHASAGLASIALAVAAPGASGQVYKCTGDGAAPVYQDAPCPPGRELRNFESDPANVSVVPMRPAPGTTSRVTAPPRDKPAKPVKESRKATSGDPAERRHVQPGMHEGEVLARLGAPDMKSGGGGRKVARWTYMPVPGDPQTLTTVVFEYGKVIEVERKVVR
ncbi:MAG: DUF4124 domain-containing protein [Burkholderiales bacterium]